MKEQLKQSLLATLLCVVLTAEVGAQPTAFQYQGRLMQEGSPANGSFDLRFTIYDSSEGSGVVGGPLTNAPTVVSNGLFTVMLDFGGGVFDGSARWLEIGVGTNGGGASTILSPRQRLASTPYAIRALTVGDGAVAGGYSSEVSFSNPANEFTGTFTGDGSSLSNLNVTTVGGLNTSNFWQTGGNAGTTPGVNFLGTTDNQPLELKVNGQRAFRIEATATAPNMVGGIAGNNVRPGTEGATIGGGGSVTFPNLMFTNTDFGTIGGGEGNIIANDSTHATVAGGSGNIVGLSSSYGAIGGGFVNAVRSSYGTIGGGYDNNILANSAWATIAGGGINDIATNSPYSMIGGGYGNSVAANAQHATIVGGVLNNIGVNADASAIGGGSNNLVAADSWYGTIGGGRNNLIGSNSPSATIGGGQSNELGVDADFSVIGGGYDNNIRSNSVYATIAGGYLNSINRGSGYSAIGGGGNNHIQADSEFATISGGVSQFISLNADYSGIGSGSGNVIDANSGYARIAGGDRNFIRLNADYTTIGGGSFNTINSNSHHVVISGGANHFADKNSTTIGGGFGNQVAADFATIAGGRNSVVTGVDSTVGGGNKNEVNSGGSTISGGINNRIAISSPWATISGGYDNTATGTGSVIGGGNANSSTNSYSTVGGGQGNIASKQFATVPGGANNTADGTYAFAAGRRAKANHTGAFVWGDSSDADVVSTNNNSVTMRASGGYRMFSDTEAAAGVFLSPGGNSWASISDRNAKKNFQPVDGRMVLDQLMQVPIQRWNYRSESDTAVPHIGPMAQEFKAAFYPGRSDTTISTMEMDGVALAAIQGVNQKLEQKQTEITELKARLEKIEQLLADKLNGGAR